MGSNLRSANFRETQITTAILGANQIKTLIFSTLKQPKTILKTPYQQAKLTQNKRNPHNVLYIKTKYLNFAL